MFDQPLGTCDTELDHLLRGVAEVRSQRRYNDRRELLLAVALADVLPGPTDEEVAEHRGRGRADWSLERRERLAPHLPHVSEMAPSHLAFAASLPVDGARALMAEALTLRHRLPRLWALLQSEHPVSVWKLREVACLTYGASPEAATQVDADLTLLLGRDPLLGAARLRDAVRRARHRIEPTVVRAEEQTQRDGRGVWLRADPDAPAVTTLVGRLDTPDARDLDATIEHLATRFAELGDERSRDLRRAAGLAALADPQAALDVASGTEPSPADGVPTPAPAHVRRVVLNLHLTPADLEPGAEAGLLRDTTAGSLCADLVHRWLRGSGTRVHVRPVVTRVLGVDPTLPAHARPEPSVDTHDPTTAIREAVLLGETSCVFPGCTVASSRCQLDHVRPYVPPEVGGAPAQTRASNLAPLCARHHRAKTHLGWAYERLPDDRYLWRSPSGLSRLRHPRPVLPGSAGGSAQEPSRDPVNEPALV